MDLGKVFDFSEIFVDFQSIVQKNFNKTYINVFDGYFLINTEPDFSDCSGFDKLIDNFIAEIHKNLPIQPPEYIKKEIDVLS